MVDRPRRENFGESYGIDDPRRAQINKGRGGAETKDAVEKCPGGNLHHTKPAPKKLQWVPVC